MGLFNTAETTTIKPWHIVVVLLLLISLIVGVYLVQRQQVYKSRAAVDLGQAFNITDTQGTPLRCATASDGVLECETNSLDVKIGIRNLDALK